MNENKDQLEHIENLIAQLDISRNDLILAREICLLKIELEKKVVQYEARKAGKNNKA